MKGRAQTAIEYLLLLSGVILFVVIVFLLVKVNVFGPGGGSIANVTEDIWDILRGVAK
ncbi:MAG: hypothetical protein ABH863_00625 [Candidatus Micrarchaeota archaeon]